ncbi:MAG: DUF5662 family protein [Candidatus Sumerlaeales bacterium]|nr:DUF5662 family protein [Candidatus Sumerlaeales bacterium]
MGKCWKHFVTITRHKWYVFKACAKVGLIWRGIVHDLSKYSLIEFFSSAKYFQGNKSPVEAEKAKSGYSIAWMNHKAKNKHHWQYWLDNKGDMIFPIEMPVKYIMEMMCDWIGAGKTYNKDKWTMGMLKNWWLENQPLMMLANKTYILVAYCMTAQTELELYKNIVSLKQAKTYQTLYGGK